MQYLEYEKKWLNWRDHLKQKCETLKKKRELKIAEKKVIFLILLLRHLTFQIARTFKFINNYIQLIKIIIKLLYIC